MKQKSTFLQIVREYKQMKKLGLVGPIEQIVARTISRSDSIPINKNQ